MKKEFIKKCFSNPGIVDTKKYRYVSNGTEKNGTIKRIELYKLDTIAALTDWITVYNTLDK